MKRFRTESRVAAALLVVVASALPGQEIEADDHGSSVEAASFLLIPLGARNVGMGGAFAGARGDVEGALWNPASLAAVPEWAVFYHGSNDFGTATHAFGGVVPWGVNRVGLSLLALDLGSIEGRDASNQPLGTIDLSNTVISLSVARPISDGIEAGATYKFVRIGGGCGGCTGLAPDATGHAFDLSVLGRTGPEDRVRLGLVLSNLGPGVAFTSAGETDPLPARLRVGGEVDVLPASTAREVDVRLRADVRQTFTEFDDLDVFTGAEVGYRSVALLRVGYAAGTGGRAGLSLGVGVRYEGFQLDLGRSFDDFAGFDSHSPFQISVAYQP
jgi:hypothetical protein